MYRCVCDWLGLPYREEVQWVRIFTFFVAVAQLQAQCC